MGRVFITLLLIMWTSSSYGQFITKDPNSNKVKDSTKLIVSALDVIFNNIDAVNKVSHLTSNRVSTLTQNDENWSKWKDSETDIVLDETKKTLKISNFPNTIIKYEGFKEFADEKNGGVYFPSIAKDQNNRPIKIILHISNKMAILYVVFPEISYRYELKETSSI